MLASMKKIACERIQETAQDTRLRPQLIMVTLGRLGSEEVSLSSKQLLVRIHCFAQLLCSFDFTSRQSDLSYSIDS
jgi:hypothetical protein